MKSRRKIGLTWLALALGDGILRPVATAATATESDSSRLRRRLHGPACGQLYAGRYSRSVGYDAAVATLRAGRSLGSVARQSARGNARPSSVAAGRRLFGRALRHVGGAGRSRPDCRRVRVALYRLVVRPRGDRAGNDRRSGRGLVARSGADDRALARCAARLSVREYGLRPGREVGYSAARAGRLYGGGADGPGRSGFVCWGCSSVGRPKPRSCFARPRARTIRCARSPNTFPERPTVISERKYGAVWYVAGGRSYMARLFGMREPITFGPTIRVPGRFRSLSRRY